MGRRAWAFCAVLATCLSMGTPTAGAVSSPSPTGGGGRQPAAERTLSTAELEAQIAAADRLRQDLEGTSAQIAGATTRLERLAVQANTLLQQYAHARRPITPPETCRHPMPEAARFLICPGRQRPPDNVKKW